jgi:hypothetical protein
MIRMKTSSFFHSLFVVGIVLLGQACGSDASQQNTSDCEYGDPTPIFNPEAETVVNHNFMKTGTEGLEAVQFENGVFLEIFQSGCEKVRQEFRFRLPRPENTDLENDPSFWKEVALQQLSYLGSMGPEYQPFQMWAQALGNTEEFKLAESREVQPGFFMKIDRILGDNSTTLLIILSQEPE